MKTALITWLLLAFMVGGTAGILVVSNEKVVFVERHTLLQAPSLK